MGVSQSIVVVCEISTVNDLPGAFQVCEKEICYSSVHSLIRSNKLGSISTATEHHSQLHSEEKITPDICRSILIRSTDIQRASHEEITC